MGMRIVRKRVVNFHYGSKVRHPQPRMWLLF